MFRPAVDAASPPVCTPRQPDPTAVWKTRTYAEAGNELEFFWPFSSARQEPAISHGWHRLAVLRSP